MQLQALAGAYALVTILPLPVDAAVERWEDAFWNILARKAGACVAVAGVENEGRDLICNVIVRRLNGKNAYCALRRGYSPPP